MVGEVFAGISAFKTMFDLAKAFKEMDTANARNTAVIDLQERILTAQAAYAELTGRVGELEAEVRSFKTWEADKQRYELHDIGEGQLVYRLKDGVEPAEPPHQICADCYQRGQRRILQAETWYPGRAHVLTCKACGSTVYKHGHPHPDHAKFKNRAS